MGQNDLVGIYRRLVASEHLNQHNDLALDKRSSIEERLKTQLDSIQAVLGVLREKSSGAQLAELSLFNFLGCFERGLSEQVLQGLLWPSE